MSKVLQSFICTVIGMATGMLIGGVLLSFHSPEKLNFYIYSMLFVMAGYTWCLLAHSKAINNERQ